MNNQENRIQLRKIVKYTTINKVYAKKLLSYGDNVELYEYKDTQVTFTQKGREFTRKKEGKRRDDSISRTRNTLYRLIACNENKHGEYPTIFVTLTFKENLIDLSIANKEFTYFIKRLNYFLDTKLKYVFIPEFQKRGAVHYHGVIFNLPWIEKDLFQSIWGNGFTRIETVIKIRDISAYVAKYLSKETLDERHFGQRIIMSSRGLIRPIEILGTYEVDNFLDTVIITKEVKTFSNNRLKYKKIKCKHKV